MKPPTAGIAAAVLAAGRSRRMGSPKPALRWRGATFLGSLLAVLKGSGLERIAVVLGPDGEAIGRKVDLSDVAVLVNPDVDRGQLSSLWIALKWAEAEPDNDGLLVCLADHPDITGEVVGGLLSASRRGDKPIIIPTFGGRRGHPTLFRRTAYDALKRAPLESGARAVLNERPDWIEELPVDHPGILKGVNTPDDLKKLQQADTGVRPCDRP